VPLLSDQGGGDTWQFLASYDIRNIWTQRSMFQFVQNLPKELLATRNWCWIADFREWLREQDHRFPVREDDFNRFALKFAREATLGTRGFQYIWVEDESVKAVYFSLALNMYKRAQAKDVLELKTLWTNYVNNYNGQAPAEGKGVFHVSEMWVEAEAESQLIQTTGITLGILLILAFVGMLVFTRSLILSFYVVIATIEVVSGLCFFIVVLMGWDLGLVEVIAIIYFVGYAVTYSLHVAHKYAANEALDEILDDGDGKLSERAEVRYLRTRYALRSIGGAALGSAITTAGASVFLVFCELTIFWKLGSMCLAATVMSIVTALGPLPSALFLFGPVRPGQCK